MFGSLGFMEMALIAIVAVVLFGGRLPEVARNFGQYYSQFRKQLSDIQSSITTEIDIKAASKPLLDDYSDVNQDDAINDQANEDFDAPPEDDE